MMRLTLRIDYSNYKYNCKMKGNNKSDSLAVIYLNQKMGALQIPKGTFHRSMSGEEGSIVLNQAVRDRNFDPKKEFIPISLRNREDLRKAKAADPVCWVWDDGRIKRLKLGRVSSCFHCQRD